MMQMLNFIRVMVYKLPLPKPSILLPSFFIYRPHRKTLLFPMFLVEYQTLIFSVLSLCMCNFMHVHVSLNACVRKRESVCVCEMCVLTQAYVYS